jgi:hypothetical protein
MSLSRFLCLSFHRKAVSSEGKRGNKRIGKNTKTICSFELIYITNSRKNLFHHFLYLPHNHYHKKQYHLRYSLETS